MVEEFIHLRKGNMSVEEYSLRVTLLSEYAPYLVSNPGDAISRFVTGVADLDKKESIQQFFVIMLLYLVIWSMLNPSSNLSLKEGVEVF